MEDILEVRKSYRIRVHLLTEANTHYALIAQYKCIITKLRKPPLHLHEPVVPHSARQVLLERRQEWRLAARSPLQLDRLHEYGRDGCPLVGVRPLRYRVKHLGHIRTFDGRKNLIIFNGLRYKSTKDKFAMWKSRNLALL